MTFLSNCCIDLTIIDQGCTSVGATRAQLQRMVSGLTKPTCLNETSFPQLDFPSDMMLNLVWCVLALRLLSVQHREAISGFMPRYRATTSRDDHLLKANMVFKCRGSCGKHI